MKKVLLLVASLFAASAANAGIITDTSTDLVLDFSLTDNFISPTAASETFTPTFFAGGSLDFWFRDRILIIGVNQERFTDPTGTEFNFSQDFGDLDFSGSYLVGSTTVNWTIDSFVTTALGGDNWSGTYTAHATTASVPEAGATVAMLGLGLVGVAALRRKLA